MQQQELKNLLRRYAAGTCTEKENKLFEDLVLRKPLLADWEWGSEEEKILMGIRIKQSIDEKRLKNAEKYRAVRRLWRVGVAASIIIVIGIAVLLEYQDITITSNKQITINERVPYSSDGITLVLSDGSEVNLADYGNEIVQQSAGFTIKKTTDRQLTYTQNEISMQPPALRVRSAAQNTIRIPNGKQFQITLPDGTNVWLNAASSLTYPVAFIDGERKVTLNGEAYFEVAHDDDKPFKVSANGTEVVVTGTDFNISAYSSDEKVTTTLFEGGVNVLKDGQRVALTPGYEATTFSTRNGIDKSKSNLEQAMAWKNGYFIFDNMDIISIMKSVARWYNIQITIDGDIPTSTFGGTFPISADLSELLSDLNKLTKVHFYTEGKGVRIRCENNTY